MADNEAPFLFEVSGTILLTIKMIWPDGDAPENPTVDDVLAVIKKDGGKNAILDDWDLLDELELTVSRGKDSKDVP